MSSSTLAESLLIDGPESIVNVVITQDPSGGYTIDYFPKRRGETTVFHTNPPHTPTLSRPRSIKWVVYGLAAGQRVEFKAKAPKSGIFAQDLYVATSQNNEVSTGNAQRSPGPALTLPWFYGMSLIDDATSTELAKIDPVVIVMDDP